MLQELFALIDQMFIREATWIQVNGYSGGLQQGYKTYNEAQSAWAHALANNVVSPPPDLTSSVSIPRPLPLQCGRASVASPLHKLQSPSIGQVSLEIPQSIIQLLPSTSSHASSRSYHIVGPHKTFKLSDKQIYWIVITGASPGVYHGK